MNDNTKIELSREIMNAMIGRACRDGFDKDNKIIKTFVRAIVLNVIEIVQKKSA